MKSSRGCERTRAGPGMYVKKERVQLGGLDESSIYVQVSIDAEIKFASRKPPDTSAEYDDGSQEQAVAIVGDLAVVVGAFETKMIIEGHTGSTDPPDYWQALAENRANLIVDTLVRRGCNRRLI